MSMLLWPAVWFLAIAALTPAFRMTSLRVRDAALPPAARDPQLGRKFALCLFTHLCLLMVLCGLTVSAHDVIWYAIEPLQLAQEQKNAGWVPPPQVPVNPPDLPPIPPPEAEPPPGMNPAPPLAVIQPPKQWWNPQQRLAVALVVSGLLHGGMAWAALLLLTNQRTHPDVSRSFVVLRFALCGLVLLTVNTLALVGFLSEGDTDYRTLAYYLAAIGVWGPAMLGHLGCMAFLYRRKLSTE